MICYYVGIFELANSTHGVNAECIANTPDPANHWQCNMANYTLPHIKSPLFIMNSLYDSWQAGCILTAEPVTDPKQNGNCNASPGFTCQAPWDQSKCSSDDISVFDSYGNTLATQIKSGLNNVSSAYINSCFAHVLEDTSINFGQKVKVNGNTASEQMGKWWNSDFKSQLFDLDCSLDNTAFKKCNPTCPQ